MSAPKDCCSTCPDPVIVEVPGVEGAAGLDGMDGVNAYTVTAAAFVVPAIGNTVTIVVADSSWMVVGQYIFVVGAGYFRVTAKPNSASFTGFYLNYTVNTTAGNTILSGSGVSPGGTQGPTGGGGVGEVYSGHYGGGSPSQTPTGTAAIAYDLDSPNNQWIWDGSTWI